MQNVLDKTDLKIISLLIDRGRIKRGELAEVVGLSIPAIGERLEKMQRKGVIRRFSAIVDTKRLGLDIMAFIHVGVESSRYYDAFMKEVQSEDRILECYSITGLGSFLLKIVTRNTNELENLLAKIQQWKGVTSTTTSLALSEIKHKQASPPNDVNQIMLN